MRAVGESHRRRGARDFLHGNTVLEITETGTAPLLLHRDAVHAELPELRPQIARKGIRAIDLVGTRGDPVGSEAADAVAQHVGGLAETEIEAADVVHAHARRSPDKAPVDGPVSSSINARPLLSRQQCA